MTQVNYKDKIDESMDDSSFWNVHDEYKGKSIEELREIQKRETLPYAVCVLNLTGDLNVGMIARTSCIFGAQEVIIFGRRKYDKRSTVGAQNYIKVSRVNGFEEGTTELSLTKFRKCLTERHYFPVFVEQGGSDILTHRYIDWFDALYEPEELNTSIPCLVFGNENEGIPKEFLRYGKVLSINQRGVLRSLNVSAAAAIVIHYFSDIVRKVERNRIDLNDFFSRKEE